MSDINAPNYTERINDILATYNKIKELKRNYEAHKEQTLKQFNMLVNDFKQKTESIRFMADGLNIEVGDYNDLIKGFKEELTLKKLYDVEHKSDFYQYVEHCDWRDIKDDPKAKIHTINYYPIKETWGDDIFVHTDRFKFREDSDDD